MTRKRESAHFLPLPRNGQSVSFQGHFDHIDDKKKPFGIALVGPHVAFSFRPVEKIWWWLPTDFGSTTKNTWTSFSFFLS